MEGVTKAFQRESIIMSDVRAIFDAVIDCFPHTELKLSTSATIIFIAPLESAVLKVQLGKSAPISREEHAALVRSETSNNLLPRNGDAPIAYVDRALKWQWLMSLSA